MSTTILSSRFNNLKDRIAAIMEQSQLSAPTTGYGQSISTPNVTGSRSVNDLSTADKITDEQYRALYTDLVRARVHQIGNAFSVEPFVVGDYLTNTSSTDKIEELYIQNLETLMTQIEVDKFEIDLATQADITNLLKSNGSAVESTRLESTTGPWNGTLSHIFTVDFGSALERRHFFNAGGQIRFSANINYPFSQVKTTLWKNTLSTMGVIAFKASSTESLSNGNTRAVGNYNLNSTYNLAFRQNIGGVYSGSYYEIYALQNSDTQIQFRIYFRDATSENIDEDIFGDLTSTIQIARPAGQVVLGSQTIDTVVVNTSIVGTELSSL